MESKTIKVSLLQMNSVIGDVRANCNKISSVLENNLQEQTDVIVLPEVWTVGWSCFHFRETAQELSNNYAIEFLSDLAKKYNTNIIGGSIIIKKDDNYYNSCPIIDKSGKLLGLYSKNHLYSYYGCDEDKYVNAGENGFMVELDGVKFGISICYDIRFPELYRAYAKAGADVLVNCAAWGSKKPIPWEMMTKSRAIENQCYMLALTQCGYIENEESNLGESRIIEYKGEEIASIMTGEAIVSSVLSLDDMYRFREKSPILKDIKDNYEVKELCEI